MADLRNTVVTIAGSHFSLRSLLSNYIYFGDGHGSKILLVKPCCDVNNFFQRSASDAGRQQETVPPFSLTYSFGAKPPTCLVIHVVPDIHIFLF